MTIPDLDRVCTGLTRSLGGRGSMTGVEEEIDKSDGVGARGFEDGDDTADCGEFMGASCEELGSTGKDGEEIDLEVD